MIRMFVQYMDHLHIKKKSLLSELIFQDCNPLKSVSITDNWLGTYTKISIEFLFCASCVRYLSQEQIYERNETNSDALGRG